MNMIIIQKQPQYILGTPIGVKVYRVEYDSPQYHDDALELILCLDGQAEITIAHRTFILEQGDIVAINPGDVHHLSSKKDNLIVSYYINTRHDLYQKLNLNKIYFDNIDGNDIPVREESVNDVRKRLLAILFYYIEDNEIVYSERLTELTSQIVEIMLDNFKLFYMTTNDNPHSQELKERFERIMMFLKENYRRKITAEELSLKEHINSNYLSQYIKKATSTGFTKILTYIRTHESELILLTKQMDIIDVAYECGFSDPKFYYKSFKELYNRTPHQHRQLYTTLSEEESKIIPYCGQVRKEELMYFISKIYSFFIN